MATRTGHLSGRTGSKLETFLNQRLCHLLEEYLPDWCSVDYEHKQDKSSRQIDVLVKLEGPVMVAIEAEINSPKGAMADADKRLLQDEAGEVNV